MVKRLSKGSQIVFAALLSFAVALLVASTQLASTAFADDSYDLSLKASSSSGSIAAGDTIVVSEVLSKDGAESFPLYALSTTVHYDTQALELVSYEAGEAKGDLYDQSGDVVFNTYSRSLAGYVMSNGSTVCSLTFKVLTTESTSISVTRVNMSNYTGMRKMPCTANGITIAVGQGVTTEPSSEASTDGTATSEDIAKGTVDAVVDTVKQDPTTALEDGELTPSGYASLIKAGMTDEELVSAGFTQEELNKVKSGESVVPSFAKDLVTSTDNEAATSNANGNATNGNASTTSNANGSSTASSTSGQDSFPVVPVVVVVVVVVVAAAVAVVLSRKKKNNQD